MSAGARRVVIVVWSAGTERPVQAAAPFVYALAARALDLEVEMHFTSTSVRWLFEGVAEAAYTDAAGTRTVADYVRDTHAAGVAIYACGMALAEHRHGETLRAECSGVAGAAAAIAASVQSDSRVLVF